MEAVLNPDQVLFEEGRVIAHKRIFDLQKGKEYLLRVFFEEQQNEKIVVSVYKTSKIEKYWKEGEDEDKL